jgi:hypothetical protein
VKIVNVNIKIKTSFLIKIYNKWAIKADSILVGNKTKTTNIKSTLIGKQREGSPVVVDHQ